MRSEKLIRIKEKNMLNRSYTNSCYAVTSIYNSRVHKVLYCRSKIIKRCEHTKNK